MMKKNWEAHLQLEFAYRAGRTCLVRKQHRGPLLVQKAFYPETDQQCCHIYLIHPPGGIVQGDQLQLDVELAARSHVLITTPAAGKFYRSQGERACLEQYLKLEAGAQLEWLPQETILYNESQTLLKTIVQLQADSRFIGWEILCLGRQAGRYYFDSGRCRQLFELWRDDKPVFIERSQIATGTPILKSPWGLAGFSLTATMVATHCTQSVLELVHQWIATEAAGEYLSVTLKHDILICRFLGHEAETARYYFVRIWSLIRPQVLGREAVMPRIWHT